MAKEQRKVKIRNLNIGAIFAWERKDANVLPENKLEFWKIIGRPTYAGQKNRATGKKEYVVLATYVKKNEDDQNVQPEKSFNIDYEVVLVKRGGKDFLAIDQRDQPRENGKPVVTPISQLSKELGQELDPELGDDDNDKDLEALIKDDESEETAADED